MKRLLLPIFLAYFALAQEEKQLTRRDMYSKMVDEKEEQKCQAEMEATAEKKMCRKLKFQEETYKCEQKIDLENKLCRASVKCEVQHRAGVDFCLLQVAKLRDSMNYSRKAILETSKCLIKPMNRHWKCMNTATQVNKKYKQLVDESYIKLKESRLEKLRLAEAERKRKAAEKRRKQREARARIARIKRRFEAAKAKEKREREIAQ